MTSLELLNYSLKDTQYSIVVLATQILFISLLHLKSLKLGLKALIFATLVGFGKWVYLLTDNNVNSFLTFKLFGISVVFYFFIFHLLCQKEKHRINRILFLLSFIIIIYSTLLLTTGVVYEDNFISDLKSFVFFILFILVIKTLNSNEIREILIASIDASAFMLVAALLFEFRFEYGDYGTGYIPINAISFFSPLLILMPLISVSNVSFIRRLFWALTCLYVLLFDDLFISGKFLILALFSFLLLLRYGSNRKLVLFFVILLVGARPIIKVVDPIAEYKLAQVLSLAKPSNYYNVMKTHTTVGNLLSEIDNIFRQPNKIYLISGKGLGGGISDENGYLQQFAGTGGYSVWDAKRNNYFKMHLPVSEIIVKFGLIGLIAYIVLIFKIIKNKNMSLERLLLLPCLLTVFYISKEYLLLTSLLIIAINNEKKPKKFVAISQ